ncbi:MAG: hypothetical protein EAZ43_02725 [Betaproteobacteria bacterium]|nr:MAG: hypothetical protein EAZ43_02725 [Betaproteobacteria bacterium]
MADRDKRASLRGAAYAMFALAAILAVLTVWLLLIGWRRGAIVPAVGAAFLAHWGRNCYCDLNSDEHNNHWWRRP